MGMPISGYNVLRVLSGGGETGETGPVKRALRPFNLFAFIIHDPETHIELHETINQKFTDLDKITGHELLFFALVDPPKEWLEHSRQRGYYKALSHWESQKLGREAQELGNPKNALTSIDKEITAFILAENLGISRDDLPCLVITSNFRSDSYLWVRTCAEHVFQQLILLGSMATYRHDMNSDLEQIHNTIDLCQGSGFTVLENSLAEALTDALEFISAINSPDPNLRKEVIWRYQKDLTNILSNLKNKLDLFKKKGPDDEEKFEGLCERITSFLADLNPNNLSRDNFINIDPQFLEDDSNRLLETAYKAMDLLERHRTDGEEIDYAPGVICLGKAFEREINLSAVHWMRQECGVDLPNYFNRFQPDLKVRNKNFDKLNEKKKKSNVWKPPTLSESEDLYKRISKEGTTMPIDPALLLDHWEQIRHERNDAAHFPQRVKRDSFNKVNEALGKLEKAKVFNVFFKMKEEYSGVSKYKESVQDISLRDVIERELNKKGAGDPSIIAKMRELSNLDGRNAGICNLAGLDIATNLQRLKLSGNNITDLSPLSSLNNLKNLEIDDNNITDLSPLSSLNNLRSLKLSGNNITDLSPLSSLNNLRTLRLDYNQITASSTLKKLSLPEKLKIEIEIEKRLDTNLCRIIRKELDKKVSGEPITVAEMKKLETLHGQNADICDLAGLEFATNLQTLKLDRNNITDLSPLKFLNNLKNLELGDNNISDLSPLLSLNNLQILRLSRNNITDFASLKELTNLKTLET